MVGLQTFTARGFVTYRRKYNRYFGLQFDQPYNDSNAMWVAETIEQVLGDHLISLQLGNEPDLYGNHGRRPTTYSIQDYFTEFASYLGNIDANPIPTKKIILGPRSAPNLLILLSQLLTRTLFLVSAACGRRRMSSTQVT